MLNASVSPRRVTTDKPEIKLTKAFLVQYALEKIDYISRSCCSQVDEQRSAATRSCENACKCKG